MKIPHAFLDMVVDKCPMVETVQKLWSLRSWCCPSLSLLTAVSAVAMVFQMSWTTSNSGDCDLAASSSYSSQWTGQVPGSCFLDKDVDVPALATSWGCRAHHGYGELMGLLFRTVYTGTRPGLTPQSERGRGGGDAGSLLPGVLPPN